jgi:hypothetical protein
VLVALVAALPVGALAQGVTHTRLRVPDEIRRPDLTGHALLYRSPGPRGDDLKALDLATGTRVLIYDTGSPATLIESVRAVPGRVAIGLRRKTGPNVLATGVLAFGADAPGGRFVTGGGFTTSGGRGGAGCGAVTTLEDLAPDGTVVTEEAVDGCGRRGAFARVSVIRAHATDGRAWDVWRHGVTGALQLLEDRKRVSLLGGRLLIWSTGLARLVNLTNGLSSVALPSARRTLIYQADADATGRLVAAELALGQRRTIARVRSVAPGAPRRGGTVLSRSRRRLPDARFCGPNLVVWSVGRDGGQRLTVRRRGRPTVRYRGDVPVPAGKFRGFACDSRTYALITDTGRRQAAVDVFRLP